MSRTSAQLLIQRAFQKKKKDFKGVSLRWMAQQLGISHVYLSQMINGSRPLALHIIDPLCEILDLDTESKAKIFHEAVNVKGYKPISNFKRAKFKEELKWTLTPKKDFDLLSSWEALGVLQTTLLKDYDGSPNYIAERLFLPEELVLSVMRMLEKKGYLVLKDGKLIASENFFEFQSNSSKKQIRAYHKSVMNKAQDALTKTDAASIEDRLITSAAFTCSQENVTRLKNKIADFLKEFVEESAASEPDMVYQFGLQFFPITDSKH